MKDLKKRLACFTAVILSCSFACFSAACELEGDSSSPSSPTSSTNPPIEETESAFEVYAGMDLTGEPLANDFTATLENESGVFEITLRGVNATKTLSQDEYAVDEEELTIYGEAFGSTVYGDVAIEVDFNNGKTQTLQEEVVTKYFSSVEDFRNMIWYGGYAGFDEYNHYIGEEGTYAYDGLFVLKKNINVFGNPNADRMYYWYHCNNQWDEKIYPYGLGTAGFQGIFDGAGYTIYNYSAGGQFSSGLFGGVSKRAVIKNLGLKATLTVGLEEDKSNLVSVLAFNFAGKLENCYLEVTVDESSTCTGNGYFPIGIHLALSKFKDVVIRFDTENVPTDVVRVGYIGGTLTQTNASWSNAATFDNLHVVLLKNNSSDYQPGSWYGETESMHLTKDGCTVHDFYDEDDKTEIIMSDSTYWDFSEDYPIFKSAK